MKPFIHSSTRPTTRRILPGHGTADRPADRTPLPGVDRAERIARRSVWTRYRADQRFQYGLGGSAGLVGAALVLVLMFFAAMGPRANVLDNTADAPSAQTPPVQTALVDAGPAEPTS
jgi:hypothetical protein